MFSFKETISVTYLYMCFFVNNQFRIILERSQSVSSDLANAFEGNLKRICELEVRTYPFRVHVHRLAFRGH